MHIASGEKRRCVCTGAKDLHLLVLLLMYTIYLAADHPLLLSTKLGLL